MTFTRTCNCSQWCGLICNVEVPTGVGASASTVDLRSSSVFTPSMKQTSAPASAASLSRVMASSMPRTWAESVRPMITCQQCKNQAWNKKKPSPTKSEPPGIESRAMTAARILVKNSSRETTDLPIRWPHRLVWTWSSICRAATPALAYCVTVRATLAGPPNLQEVVLVRHDPLLNLDEIWRFTLYRRLQ